MKQALLEQVLEDRAAKRPVVVATDLASGVQRLIHPQAPEAAGDPLRAAAQAALRADRSGAVETPEGRVFLQVFNPPLRLLIVGAVHIAQPLARMAALAGYAVTVIDPRRAFASAERFPGVDLVTDWPDEALDRLAPDGRTAVVTLTHDPKLDDPALASALNSGCFYIGALGSRKTHAARLERLRRQGFGEGALARIHGPVGLDIGARSPAEIAIAILAEITASLRQEKAAEEAA